MHVALILGGMLVGTGTLLYLLHRFTEKTKEIRSGDNKGRRIIFADKNQVSSESECCGLHITCQRDSLSPVFNEEIVYFDDDELDVYSSVSADEYTEADIEAFRDVLLTLRPEEIGAWARSIQLRHITLPDVIKDELFLLVEEARK